MTYRGLNSNISLKSLSLYSFRNNMILLILSLMILTGKNCFTQFSTIIYWNRSLAASDLFHMFTQSINFYAFHCQILKSIDVCKKWFIKYVENERLLLSASFTAKIWVGFCLNTEKNFLLLEVSFESQQKEHRFF